jgi:hypothetical protein
MEYSKRIFKKRIWTIHLWKNYPFVKLHIHWGHCMCEINHILKQIN